MGVWWGQGGVRSFSSWYFSRVRMMEKAELPEKRDRKGKRITRRSGTTFTCYLFLLLGKEKTGEEQGFAQMKLCPGPLAGCPGTSSLTEEGGLGSREPGRPI